MKKETLKETGKGFIGFANLIGGFSIINSLFGASHNLPTGITVYVVLYITISFYIAGIKLIDKGAD